MPGTACGAGSCQTNSPTVSDSLDCKVCNDRYRPAQLTRWAGGGLTVRCFRNDRRPDGCVRHTWPGWCGGQAGVRGGLLPGQVSGRLLHAGHRRGHVVVLAVAIADMATRAVRSRTRCPGSRLPQAAAAYKAGEDGRCLAGTSTPAAVREQERSCRRHCRTLPLWPSATPSRFRTPADALPRPVITRRLR
jgi:hypothetical protein